MTRTRTALKPLIACLALSQLHLLPGNRPGAVAATLPTVKAYDDLSYGLMIDAGSSGSRVYAFHWLTPTEQRLNTAVLPLMNASGKEQLAAKIKPGLSAVKPADVADYLAPLIRNATQFIPADRHADTPIYLKATAGMRLLPAEERKAIIDAVSTYFGDKQRVPFKFDTKIGAQVIPGEDEGVYGWLTTNALLSNLVKPDHSTVAALDLGGASTQITFEPPVAPLSDSYPIRVNGTARTLYTHSYLRLGVDEARKRVVAALAAYARAGRSSGTPVNDPCQLRGANETFKMGPDASVELAGTGQFDACYDLVRRVLLGRDAFCAAPPCAINGIHQPPIPATMPIYAATNYFETANAFGCRDQSTAGCLLQSARQKCSTLDIEAAATAFPGSVKYLNSLCFNAALVVMLLSDGYGLSLERPVIFAKETHGGALEWALGSVIDIVGTIKLNLVDKPPTSA